MSVLSLHSLTRQTRSQTTEFTQFSQKLPPRSRSPRKRVQKPTIESHDSQSETNLAGESIPSGFTTKDDPFRDRSNIHRFSPSQSLRQVQMSPPPIPASIYNTAQISPAVSEEDSSSRDRTLGPSPSNSMSTLPPLEPPQTSSRSLQSYLEETPSTVRPNAPAAVEMTFASNSQDSNTEARAKFNAQPTQNIQPIASSSGQRESQAIQSSQINLNSTSLQEYIANLQQQGFTSKQIAQLVSARKEKKKVNETLVSIEDDEATFERSAFDDDSGDSNEITEEDKQQKMNMLNAAVPPGTAIEIPSKILSIYQEIRDDLKALWLDRTNPQAVSTRTESNTIVSSENLDQMIAPPSARGVMPQQSMYFTSWEIVTGVMPAATDTRVLVNADTPNLPRYFLYPEAVFEKRVTKHWLTNIQLTSVMKRENAILRLWTDIARVDYMMKVMTNSGSRNAIDYVHLIYKENNSQSHLRKEEWQTKSGFFSIANKEQGNMMLRQLAQTDEKATRGWALCKTADLHSETGLSLTNQEKEQMPWLTSQHYVPFQTIADDTVTYEGSQTRSQLQQSAFFNQQSALAVQQSAFTAQQSMLAAQSPALATQQPMLSTQQPAFPTQQSALPTQQPALSTQQPALSTQQSALPIQQPALSTQQPALPIQQSMLLTQ